MHCERCGELTFNDLDSVSDEVLCDRCIDQEAGESDDEDEDDSILDNPLKYKGWNPLSNEW